jgi:hypothetical protein
MAHQYVHDEKASSLEIQYNEFLDVVNDPIERTEVINKILKGNHPEVEERGHLLESLNPNEQFVKSYNERTYKETQNNTRKKRIEDYNEDGKRYAKFWETCGFKRIHDPLKIYEKKGNYEDLAWRVHQEVEDYNIFLKVLYFPRITWDDYQELLDVYEDSYRSFNNKKRFLVYPAAAGALISAWAFSYAKRLKFSSFLGLSIGSFFLAHCGLSNYYNKSMKNQLNAYADSIAKKYPEIKYSRLHFVTSEELNQHIAKH